MGICALYNVFQFDITVKGIKLWRLILYQLSNHRNFYLSYQYCNYIFYYPKVTYIPNFPRDFMKNDQKLYTVVKRNTIESRLMYVNIHPYHKYSIFIWYPVMRHKAFHPNSLSFCLPTPAVIFQQHV